MAQMRNAAQFYKQNSVETASPGKIILMLYDGTIRFCNIARGAMEGKENFSGNDIGIINENLKKAQRIIVQLRMDLDMKYPVAKEFDAVYDYIYRRLVEANLKKDIEILDEALGHIKTMRETWIEVMKANHVS